MKKALFVFMVVGAVLLLFFTGCGPSPEQSWDERANPVTDFEYEENDTGITISSYIGNSQTVVIPRKIDGKDVTEIGSLAFMLKDTITSVEIPDTVTVIGGQAFDQCISLTKVVLPSNLRSLGGAAFQDCTQLSSIALPEKLEELGGHAFKNCTSLKHIRIPKTVKKWGIGETFVFSGLETVEFEEGLETIGQSAFGFTKLTKVTLPDSVKEIGFGAFGGCANLESITLNEGLVTIGSQAFGGKSKLKEIVIPKSVKNMTENAFSGCSTLEKVKFEGDAPSDYKEENPDLAPVSVSYTIYYHEGAKGFASPEWCGYKTEKW